MADISVFDLDRTLTRRPTYSAFLLFAALRLAPWRLFLLPVLAPVALAYVARLIPRRRMKESMHALALGRRVHRRRIEGIADRFAERVHGRGLYQEALELVAAEKAQGRRVVLATAAPEIYVTPLARRMAIADVLASSARWTGDVLHFEMEGENCYGAAKHEMIRQWLERSGVTRRDAHVRFYSDHESDMPTFDWCDEPVAVNPSSRMRDIATRRGWLIVDWRRG